MDSLRAAMEQHKVAEKLAPNWIPEGYVCLNVSASKTPKELSISAMYERDKEYLIIKIRQVFGTTPQQIEKSEDLIETYSVNGVDYYIFSNNESLQTAWVVGEFECVIAGKITMEEMKRVIDSI